MLRCQHQTAVLRRTREGARQMMLRASAPKCRSTATGTVVGALHLRQLHQISPSKVELQPSAPLLASHKNFSRANGHKHGAQGTIFGSSSAGIGIAALATACASGAALYYGGNETEPSMMDQMSHQMESKEEELKKMFQSLWPTQIRSSAASCEAAAAVKGEDDNSDPSALSKPRNVMLHRIRSIKARCLQDKYDVNWKEVLGEGGYGAVYPARLRSTGEKVGSSHI
jgi:hypothetical protein